jgi:hypothetical protein
MGLREDWLGGCGLDSTGPGQGQVLYLMHEAMTTGVFGKLPMV